MTLTEARALARRARQHGYFDTGLTVWVSCPGCRTRVETMRGYRAFKAAKGRPANIDPVTGARTVFRQEKPAEALDRAMTDHALAECPGPG